MEQNSFYSIVSSYTLRSNSIFEVAVSVHKSKDPCEMKLTIKGPNYENVENIEVQPMSIQNVQFQIENILPGDYELQAEGLKGIIFKKTIPLHYQENKPLVFIQTDKATYKPSDLIQFRVIFMDDCTRPAVIDKPVNLTISDAQKNRLKYWHNISLGKGVFKGQYQLTEQPILGRWRIDVTVEGETFETKYFEVDRYVLPKFNVTVEAPKDVAIHDGIVNVTIRAQYTYGKSVKGRAVVSIEPKFWSYNHDTDKNMRAEKTIEVNGRGQLQFKVTDDFCIERNFITTMEIKAIMEEEITGNKMEAITTVDFHEHRFHFDGVDVPYDFHPGVPLKLKIAVKHLDYMPVLNSNHPLKLTIENRRHYIHADDENVENFEDNENSIVAELTANLDEAGIANFEYTFPADAQRFYYLKCQYEECERHFTTLSKYEKPEQIQEVNEPLSVSVLTKEPKLDEDFEFEVNSSDEIPYFIYTIHSRGKHLKTEMISLPKDRRSHIIRLRPNFDMIPYATIFVHYVDGKDLRFDETTISFEQEFENSIEIIAPTDAKPSEEIVLKVKTDPDSYVALSGVDQSVYFLRSGNDLDRGEVFHALGRLDNSTASRSMAARCPGENSGLVTLTNAIYPVYDVPRICMFSPGVRSTGMNDNSLINYAACEDDEVGEPVKGAIRIRKEFPESWIFDDFENVPADGLSLQRRMPDTITSWVLTGFSLNPRTGIATTKEPATIKTFRPFFAVINLPYSVKRGEQVTLPVLVFNYMDKDVVAEVSLDNTDKDFEFVESIEDQNKSTKKLSIPANSGGHVNFVISSKRIGHIMLKVTAICPLAGDVVHKELKVEPEGMTVYSNRDFYLNAESGAVVNVNELVKLDIPENVVPDSEFIEFTVMGNLLSTTITNIDNLVRLPAGCGEQIMVNFVPNILILQYLETMQELTTNIEEKAKRFLEIGYQRELTYKHNDGSYSVFGKSDDAGSTWLTAYVIRSFHQATKYIDVDMKIIEAGLEFLASSQVSNGSFIEKGRVLDAAHLNEVGLTAFVLLTFLENKEFLSKYEKTIERGFEFLQQSVENTKDLYALAIAVFALQQRKVEIVHEMLARLEASARSDGGMKWWTSEGQPKESNYIPGSHDVEITGYILMTLLDRNETAVPVTKWLVAQRNCNGGYGSTQETVVGLWALIKFAEKHNATNSDLSITVTTPEGDVTGTTFDVKKNNSMIVQSLELPKHTREMSFSGHGCGTAVVQISYRYNILETKPQPSFKLIAKRNSTAVPARMLVDIFVAYTPSETSTSVESNMVVMEVSLPSGYTALAESLGKIQELENVKRVETERSNNKIVIYFDNLKISDEFCVPIEAEATHEITEHKAVPIVIYDYYDNAKCASVFYEIESD